MSFEYIVSGIRDAVVAVVVMAASLASLYAGSSTAQEVVRIGGAVGPLAERVEHAMQRASSQASGEDDSAMVGYGIVVRAPANDVWGMYSLKNVSRTTLAELIDGRRYEDTEGRNGSDADRFVERRAAVMIRLDSAGEPQDVQLFTLDSIADFHVDTIYWLGDATIEASFDLLVPYTDSRHDSDVRRGAVYAIARHGLPDRSMPILTGLIRNASEPPELRKAAVYGLGMLRSNAARRALLDLIYDETS